MAVLLFISDKQQNDLLRSMATDKALPREKGSDARIPLSHTVISSASEKSFSFAVKKKRESIGKWETRYSIRSWLTAFHSRRKQRAVNEKLSRRRL